MILSCSLDLGGAENHIYKLVTNINEEKYNFVIICLYELGTIGEMLLKRNGNITIYHNVMKNRIDLIGILKLIRIMKKENADILYISLAPLTLFWGIFSAKLTGIKAFVARSQTTNTSGSFRKLKIVNRLTLNCVNKIIAQAYSHKEYLVNRENIDPEKVIVIYNGVEIDRFSKPVDEVRLKQAIGISLGMPVVGIVGNLSPRKGHMTFLKAARKVIESFPDVLFLIVGDGIERKNLERMSRELSIQEKVLFLGSINDISHIVPLIDIAVLSSRPVGETFSNAILEYMAASKPVVATNVGSLAEQVVDGETGYLVPHDDYNALSESILRLLKDSNMACAMGKAGREMVEEKFTIQKMVKKYESLFEDLMAWNN